ncbi:Tn3 family transposase [Streptomyces europaeiscabiei]|uniref:Tn3 family transposase n=1 Tax=Streptomyces europaeiscabiei TaxID=146819 RepID=A0AAJ2PP29_9ACTN|nr:Tn3 family transposase [Streptomyces europaeiscabiei]MDX3131067.1 Tn3 family transposase [Streptomyces europaeiscabiei]
MVVRGTPRDSLYTLYTLLNLDGGVKPEMVATDNASYADMALGLYKMLGFRFAPRFRDLADERFWRADLPDGEAPADFRQWSDGARCPYRHLRGQHNDQG